MMAKLPKLFWIYTLFALTAGGVLGCGGGTRGTGGTDYQGTLYSSSGVKIALSYNVVPGVNVVIANSGDSGVTDKDGFYHINSDVDGTDVELFFSGKGLDTKFSITVPSNTELVTADFEVNTVSNTVTPLQIQIKERDPKQDQKPSDPDSDGSPGDGQNGSPDNSGGNNGGNGDGSNNGGGDSTDPSGGEKTTICHNPDGSSPSTISVSDSALESHLAHGDTMGSCPDSGEDKPGGKKPKEDKGTDKKN